MKNNNPDISLCYQAIRRSEYGSMRDVVHISVQRRVSVLERLAGTVNNRDGYGYSGDPAKGMETAMKMQNAYSEMLNAGIKEFYDYEIGHSFEMEYLLTDGGRHCSPTINASGSMTEVAWAAKTVQKIAIVVEKNRAKAYAKEQGIAFSTDSVRLPGNWSLETLDEVTKALDTMGVKVHMYKSPTFEYFSHLVEVK